MRHTTVRRNPDYRRLAGIAIFGGLVGIAMLGGGLVGTPRVTPVPLPPDSTVTAAMQSAIARELPSWRGVIAETGGLPSVEASGAILFVATTLGSAEVDGLNDLCVAVSIWAKAAAPSLTNVVVMRSRQELAKCRVL